MKRIACFLMLVFILTSCSVKKKPIFLKMDDVKVLSFKTDTVRLQAKAYFKNENDIGGTISTDAINVSVNGLQVAKVSSQPFKVPANKEFQIPLQVAIPTQKVFGKENGGFLNGLLGSLVSKSIKVQFKGEIKYKVLGFSSIYEIDKTEEVQIKL